MQTDSTPKLFLLDAMALIYRAYFAFSRNPRYNSKGMNTSAIFGFTNTLLDVLNNQKPTHIAVVFDTAAPTERHETLFNYKANRQETPEDIIISIPYIKKIIEAFNIPVLSVDGYEADDIIGTLAIKAEQNGFTTYIMSPDKDLGQVISDNIFLYKPARNGEKAEIVGKKEICEKFNIHRPEQIADILGLWGDAVDNIPGVPGIGEKTAKILIHEYGSVEEVLRNTDKLKGKLKDNLIEFAEQAIMSKRLATLITDSPIEFDEKKLIMEEIDKEKLLSLFEELEFRGLTKRLFTEEKTLSPPPKQNEPFDLFNQPPDEIIPQDDVPSEKESIHSIKHEYHLVDTTEKIDQLLIKLNQQKQFCFDTETTSLNIQQSELVGISFSYQAHQGWFVPIPEQEKEAKVILEKFKPLFENTRIGKIGQNMKYDMGILKKYGIEVKGKLFDTIIAHYLIQPDMLRRNINVLAETYLNYQTIAIETLIGKKGKDQQSMRSIPIEQLVDYACEDADIAFQLKNIFEPLLKEAEILKIFEEIEIPLIEVLTSMEAEGVKVDKQTLNDLSLKIDNETKNIQETIFQLAGSPFNISSPKQVGEILFERLQVTDKAKKTKTGQYATGEEVLEKLAGKHPIIDHILEYRELQKLQNTYISPLPNIIYPPTGRIHTTYNQVVASTGRLSSDNPNLQNIPIRTERGREIRKAFIPRNDDYILISADYSQVELRIIAELSQDEGMIEAFNKGEDIHASTASKVYDIPLEEVSKEMRRNAKMVNFGISYGISAFGLSQRLNIPRKEAAHIIEQYFSQYPKVKEYMDNTIEFAKTHGYVKTMLGRRRYLRDINSLNATVRGYAERNAINAPIQGTAADMIKIAMINIYDELQKNNFKTKMILQVHDELVFDAPKEEIDAVKPLIVEKMKTAIAMDIPIVVDIGTGNNWLEAH